MPRAVLFPLALLSLAGCAAGTAQQRSAGPTGCQASEIVIEDLHANLVRGSWTARCRGRIFHCTAADQATECVPDPSTPATPEAAPRPGRSRSSAPAPR